MGPRLTPPQLLADVIVPALAIFPVGMGSIEARCMLVATSKQESDIADRDQGDDAVFGPAVGLWQFERAGVIGVIQNSASDDLARMVAREAKIACSANLLLRRVQVDDLLACRLARLLLWTDKAPLPKADLGYEGVAWDYYKRNWRPGAAKDPQSQRYADARKRWRTSWRIAVEACTQ